MKEKQPWEDVHHATLHVQVPVHFRMLCALLQADLADVLLRFMQTAGCENYNPHDFSKPEASSFFVLADFGRPLFNMKEVRQMIDELAMIQAVYPGDADGQLLNDYMRWRSGYRRQWYESWLRRREEKNKTTGNTLQT